MAVLTDSFDDNSRDTVKWALGSIAFENLGVTVSEVNQQLEITPIANEATPAISGYKSVSTYDFTGLEVKVRLTANIGSPSEAWLVVVLDANNYVRIWGVGGGNLFTRSRVAAGNANEDHGVFVFATHTHWKIRHDKVTDEIVWAYSSDGVNWVELRRLARPFSITAVTIYLSGGSGNSSPTPPALKFDDLVVQGPESAALFRGRNFPLFDDEEVNRFEFWPAIATGVEFERAVTVDTTASIATTAQSFSVFERSVAVTATAAVATTAQFLSVFERAVAVAGIGTLATDAFRIIERNAAITSTAAVTVVSERIVERAVSLSATAAVTTSAQSFTPFESAVVISASASIETSATSFSVFERSVSLSSASSISSNGFRIVERTVSVTATVTIQIASESFSVLERIVAVTATGVITTSAHSILERQTTVSGTAAIATTRQLELSRQSSLSTTGTISVTGGVVGGVFEHERSVAVSASGAITSAATFFSVMSRSAQVSITGTITTDGFVSRERTLSLAASGVITVSQQRDLLRTASIATASAITVSGTIEGTGINRSVSLSASATITVSYALHHPAPPRRTFMVSSSERTAVVRRELREFKPGPESRESVIQ